MKKMEGGDQNLGNGGGSRWNPTKEQIDMLESLYKQGLRTPTAEQIQQITTSLQAFGHIEGKNVFYWFQNHKARQRQKQKQKQETFAYYNRFLHAPPVFPPYHNVVCSPCYIPPVPKNDPVFYQHYPKAQLPTAAGSFNRSRLIPESTYQTGNQNPTCTQRYNAKSMDYLQFISSTKNTSSHRHETLNLFPIHPTGILQSRSGTDHGHDNKNPRTACANTPSISSGAENVDDDDDGHPFYDFFCGK